VQAAGKVAQEIRALRAGLAPTPERPLSQEQLARLLGVSWSTIARWETGGEPGAEMAQKLLRLHRAVELLGDMVTPEYRVPFFEQRHPMLLKLRPIDLLDTPEGAELVYRRLEAAQTGAFG
jgi:transcriptional regulator with XRE-family HTH domain